MLYHCIHSKLLFECSEGKQRSSCNSNAIAKDAALPLPQHLAMSSLADELMNDLDSDSGGEEEQQPIAGPSSGAELATQVAMDDESPEVEVTDEMVVPEGGVKPTLELDPESVDAMEMSSVAEVGKVAKLAGSKQMKEVLTVRCSSLTGRCKATADPLLGTQKVEYYREHPDPNLASDNDSAEYQLIVQANNLSVEIDNEMLIVHKVNPLITPIPPTPADPTPITLQFIRDHYLARFPELDSLVSAPLPFCRVILALGNNEDLRGDIGGILTSGAVMAVTVTAATSKGEPLEEREWQVVTAACNMMFTLDEAKKTVRRALFLLLERWLTQHRRADPRVRRIPNLASGTQHLCHRRHSNRYQDPRYRWRTSRTEPYPSLEHLRELPALGSRA